MWSQNVAGVVAGSRLFYDLTTMHQCDIVSLMNKVIKIASKRKIPTPHEKRKAQEIINKLAENGDNVSYSSHARERMRRGFTYNDMLLILREGAVREEPRYDEEKRSWAYKVDFLKFDGNRDASCVVAIRKKGKLHVITVMWIDL